MAEPKYRFVKMPKPPAGRGIRGIQARQRFQRSGGRKKQILNPETGKYVDVLPGEAGKQQLQKFYPTEERGESIKKVGEAKKEQAKRKTEAQKKFDAAVEDTKKKRKERAAKAEPPPPTTGRLTRGPEAPLPPPRIRITEEAPKPPMVDLAELPIRDQKELNAVLKDLKNRVISPDFKTPTQDEIAEAVTKATGGRFTPPTSKVAEPPPPKVEPVVPSKGTKLFGKEIDPNASELDKLKERYNTLKDTRFIADPGPEYFQGLKKLEEQIMALDPNFVGEFSSSEAISPPTKVDIPGGGQVTLPSVPAVTTTPTPAPSVLPPFERTDSKLENGFQEPTPVVPAPRPAPPSAAELNTARQAFLKATDPLYGVRETYVPTNILGQTYDPRVREDYARRMLQAGANIQQGGSPSFEMPTSAVPQVQFGGYGAPAPMAALAPYAGMGAPPPPPQLASGAVVNPGTGKAEPVGYVPPRMLQGPIT